MLTDSLRSLQHRTLTREMCIMNYKRSIHHSMTLTGNHICKLKVHTIFLLLSKGKNTSLLKSCNFFDNYFMCWALQDYKSIDLPINNDVTELSVMGF